MVHGRFVLNNFRKEAVGAHHGIKNAIVSVAGEGAVGKVGSALGNTFALIAATHLLVLLILCSLGKFAFFRSLSV